MFLLTLLFFRILQDIFRFFRISIQKCGQQFLLRRRPGFITFIFTRDWNVVLLVSWLWITIRLVGSGSGPHSFLLLRMILRTPGESSNTHNALVFLMLIFLGFFRFVWTRRRCSSMYCPILELNVNAVIPLLRPDLASYIMLLLDHGYIFLKNAMFYLYWLSWYWKTFFL
jgi:hypothetical protein